MDALRPVVAVNCGNCGKGPGRKVVRGLRCMGCGQFADPADDYCLEHDLDYEGLYPEDNHCPYCREERRQRDAYMHEMTRDPQVEPY